MELLDLLGHLSRLATAVLPFLKGPAATPAAAQSAAEIEAAQAELERMRDVELTELRRRGRPDSASRELMEAATQLANSLIKAVRVYTDGLAPSDDIESPSAGRRRAKERRGGQRRRRPRH